MQKYNQPTSEKLEPTWHHSDRNTEQYLEILPQNQFKLGVRVAFNGASDLRHCSEVVGRETSMKKHNKHSSIQKLCKRT